MPDELAPRIEIVAFVIRHPRRALVCEEEGTWQESPSVNTILTIGGYN